MTSSRITVQTTPTLIATGTLEHKVVTLRHYHSGANIWIGGDDQLTPANGFSIRTDESLTIQLGPRETLYAIAKGEPREIEVLDAKVRTR